MRASVTEKFEHGSRALRREAIDTSPPTGKMVFTILASVAELERSTIRERVMAGQRAAKRRGVRFGRPALEVDTECALKLRKQGAESEEGRLRLKENTFPFDTYPTQRGTARVPRVGECADKR